MLSLACICPPSPRAPLPPADRHASGSLAAGVTARREAVGACWPGRTQGWTGGRWWGYACLVANFWNAIRIIYLISSPSGTPIFLLVMNEIRRYSIVIMIFILPLKLHFESTSKNDVYNDRKLYYLLMRFLVSTWRKYYKTCWDS